MIEVEALVKRYGEVTAVDRVSFRIGPGEVVGVLGPNGAGKSTLFRVLSTWLAPDAGSARVLGFDVVDDDLEVRRRIGYLAEHNALYDTMSVREYLRFTGRMRGLDGGRLGERLDEVAAVCDLGPVLGRPILECSKGNRQRAGVAAALLHDPPVLILDEPTHGLDPIQVASFLEFLRGLREGRAVLFSNHVLAELAAVSDRLLVLQRGRLVADEPLAVLEERAAAAGASLDRLLLDAVLAGAGRGAAEATEEPAR